MTDTTNMGERHDLLQSLATHREFLRFTAKGLSDEQASLRSTVSELCIGGLIKHVAATESSWVDFMTGVPGALVMPEDGEIPAEWAAEFQLAPGETLAGMLDRYEEVARRTDDVVASIESLDASQPLPAAPWFEPGARWSARRVVLHIIGETAQHAGHADIIREAIDGSKTMG